MMAQKNNKWINKDIFKKYVTGNFSLKIISLLIAFLIWGIVANMEDPVMIQRFSNVPITIKNADVFMEKVKKVYIPKVDSASEREIDTVSVYVKAKRSIVDMLTSANFTVTADFENIVQDLNTIPLEISCDSVPSLTMQDMWCDLRSLKVELEDIKDATFVVTVREVGKPADGCQIGDIKLNSGESVAIAGPISDMNKIGKVVVPVNVGNMTHNGLVSASIKIFDKNEEEFKASQMERLTIKTVDGEVFKEKTMEAKVTVWKIKSGIVPNVEITGQPASGYRIARVTTTPSTISLAGSSSTLKSLLNHLEIKGMVSAEGATQSFTKEINLKEYLEDNYKGVLEQEKDLADIIAVNVQIEQIGTTTIDVPVSEIKIIGKPDNMSYKLTPADKISVEVQALRDNVQPLTSDDIGIIMDLSDPKYSVPSNYKVELKVTLPEGYKLASTPVIAVNLIQNETTEDSAAQIQ